MPRIRKDTDDFDDDDDEDYSQDVSPVWKKSRVQPEEEIADRRRRQVRNAQRAYRYDFIIKSDSNRVAFTGRQRQQHYTEGLEERVAMLSAILTSKGIPIPSRDGSPKISSACACRTEIAHLKTQNGSLQHQLAEQILKANELTKSLAAISNSSAATRPPPLRETASHFPERHTIPISPYYPPELTDTASVSTRTPCVSSKRRIADLVENDDITSSTELFGEYQLGSFADWLRPTKIPAFAAEEFVDLMKRMATCTSCTTLRKLLVNVSLSKNALRNILDSDGNPLIVEALELTKSCGSNALHWRHWYQSIAANLELDTILEINSPQMPLRQVEIVQQLSGFRTEVSKILSIADRGHLVQALCVELAALKLCAINDREKHYANILATQGLLQSLCETSEDRKSSESPAPAAPDAAPASAAESLLAASAAAASASAGPGAIRRRGRHRLDNEDVADKRVAQNRNAQRAFRERKQRQITELDDRVRELQDLLDMCVAPTPPALVRVVFPLLDQLLTIRTISIQARLEQPLEDSAPPTKCASCHRSNPANVTLITTQADILRQRLANLTAESDQLKKLVARVKEKLEAIEEAEANAVVATRRGRPKGSTNDTPASMAEVDTSSKTGQTLAADRFALDRVFSESNAVGALQQLQRQPQQQSLEQIPMRQTVPNATASVPAGIHPSPPLLQPLFASDSSGPSSISSASPIQSNRAISSSNELFGTLLADSFRFALKQLPSLWNNYAVDGMIDAYLDASRSTDVNSLKRSMIRAIRFKHAVLDSCQLHERPRVIEITEEYKGKNNNILHFNYFYQNISDHEGLAALKLQPLTPQQSQVLEHLRPFEFTLKSIPSLRGNDTLIEELCLEFSAQGLFGNVRERQKRYLSFVGLTGEAQALCTTQEDRTRFFLALEVMRETNRAYSDQYVTWVMDDIF
ncbi:hypothetical protein HDU83_008977 [Entophlyctis luteolus]|nr:hypothetical protein HDU83_008977 [Entophlyctis luteolus]